MPFLSFGIKNIAKSLAVSRILLTFAVRVGADGKERLRRRLERMSVLSVILRDRNVEVSKSAMIICNSAHAYGLLYLVSKGKK